MIFLILLFHPHWLPMEQPLSQWMKTQKVTIYSGLSALEAITDLTSKTQRTADDLCGMIMIPSAALTLQQILGSYAYDVIPNLPEVTSHPSRGPPAKAHLEIGQFNAPNRGAGSWQWKGRRSGSPLEHQSQMTGKPIRVRQDGVSEIQEYVVNDVSFDDFSNGVLLDHKAKMPTFMIDENGLFKSSMKGPADWRAEAWRQVEAANGLPVEWVVDPSQVKAFDTLLRRIPGIRVRY